LLWARAAHRAARSRPPKAAPPSPTQPHPTLQQQLPHPVLRPWCEWLARLAVLLLCPLPLLGGGAASPPPTHAAGRAVASRMC
jgi:hypothetical protein